MKGYATTEQVATYMHTTFDDGQEELATLMIGAAEDWIDNNIHHAWLEAGPITEDHYDPQLPYIRLNKPPIVSVASVSVTYTPGWPSFPLIPTYQYAVQDLPNGVIYSPLTQRIYLATVVYTPNSDPVPNDVALATRVLAASYMGISPTMLDGVDPHLVQKYQVGGELTVEFRKTLWDSGPVPRLVLDVLDKWLKNYAVV